MIRKYRKGVVEELMYMFHNEITLKSEENRTDEWDRNYNSNEFVWDKDNKISSDFKITPEKTVEDLFELYDENVPKERRLFVLHYDASLFQGIFTIDELIEKLEKDHYFDDNFWSYHRSKEEARKDFEDYKYRDGMNIAYEALWGVERIV